MKNLDKKTIGIAAATLIVGILLGWMFFGTSSSKSGSKNESEQVKNQIWTCSMHPHVKQPEPGQCPICGMDLIPLNQDDSDENSMEIRMSPTAMQLANVQTSIVKMTKPVKEIRINGKVKADERRVYSQSSHIPGRIERLLVNATGEYVSKGQVLAYIYSPELVLAQDELFEAFKIKESQPLLFQAAKGKLMNWKLSEKQIENMLKAGKSQELFAVHADVSGVVLTKRINLGDYIKTGESLFEVADLSSIWVLFDVYENDLQWIKKGDEVTFTVNSLPGTKFKSRITFIDPVINPKTRVASARVEMVNKAQQLKPNMFVVGEIESPLHNQKEAIIVPRSSVMWTGERSVIYIKHVSESGIGFMMREVLLGASLGHSYIIEEGLEVGEEIATNGTFSIDAAAQLAGKPSMMNPNGGPANMGHNHGGGTSAKSSASQANMAEVDAIVKESLAPLFEGYLIIKEALVADNLAEAKRQTVLLLKEMNTVKMSLFKGDAHKLWMENSERSKTALNTIIKSENIGLARQGFKTLSDQFVHLAETFGPFQKTLYVQHCPMANSNLGADWLSSDQKITNPYFGKGMLTCGEVTQTIE
ncbi:MAG: Cu(I)/Ag(I) efflux system membrane fusion protein [Bacteroidia bacterium]|jgi:Cu(I)/Ag(I) efflux system membrane fusion protein